MRLAIALVSLSFFTSPSLAAVVLTSVNITGQATTVSHYAFYQEIPFDYIPGSISDPHSAVIDGSGPLSFALESRSLASSVVPPVGYVLSGGDLSSSQAAFSLDFSHGISGVGSTAFRSDHGNGDDVWGHGTALITGSLAFDVTNADATFYYDNNVALDLEDSNGLSILPVPGGPINLAPGSYTLSIYLNPAQFGATMGYAEATFSVVPETSSIMLLAVASSAIMLLPTCRRSGSR